MSAATLVIILVGSGEAGSDWAAGTLQALREALDRRVAIELSESPDPPPAGAYQVSVEFSRDQKRATLRCVQPAGRQPKRLEFKRSDRPLDRGRAVGYALGALLPELRADAPAVEPAPPPAPTPEPPAASPSPPAPPPPAAADAQPPPAVGRLALEATGFVSSSFVSSQPGFGGSLSLELRTLDWLGVRLGAGAAFGNSPLPSEATLRELIGRLGARARLWAGERTALSLLAHALLVQVAMHRATTDRESWRGGAELSVELALRTTAALALFLKPTARTTFGAIQIYVDGQRVAAITPFVFALELGLRVTP